MGNKRTYNEYSDRHQLRNAGWDVSKTDNVALHTADETYEHLALKAASAHYLKHIHDFRVDSEVENAQGKIADIVGYGHDDKRPIVIEVETNATKEVIQRKREYYVENEPFREMFVVDPLDLDGTLMGPLWVVDDEIGWGLE